MAASAGVDDVSVLSSSPSRGGKRSRENKNPNDVKKSAKKTKKKMNKDGDDRKIAKRNQKNNNGSSTSSSLKATASCSFPMSRVRRLVRGEAGNSTTDTRTTHDAVFLINKASEMFLQRFAQDAHTNAVRNRKKSISYHHLSSTVCNGKRYEFLSDFVPEKVKAEDALKAKALAEM